MLTITKKIIRLVAGIIVSLPFMVSTWFLSLFIGQQRATKIIGPFLKKTAKFLVGITIPKIDRPEEFDLFREKLKKNLAFWNALYDVSYIQDNSDMLKINIHNCPFCEMFGACGLKELGKYTCQGDLAVAEDNSNLWDFTRSTEIGYGGRCCDNTYSKKK
ncbi:MAG: L-2-amino-thiazoline-4-carboxylic acid hydrolase [bacterium]|nr:L-2-amino-thiazoline-4-carboxylic acid hydrolase [bacterium]